MKDSWNFDLMNILKQARLENASELNVLLNQYSPLAVANEDYTVLLILRHFEVSFWKDKRSVLNCHPQGAYFQCGITITTSNEDAGTQSNVYIPNNLEYESLEINGKEIVIKTDKKAIKTNLTELYRKLEFWEDCTEAYIDAAFKSLCNEKYEAAVKPEVTDRTMKLPSVGTLTYNEAYEWYECNFVTDNDSFDISILHTTPEKSEKIRVYADNQIQSGFYKKMLAAMQADMVELKNNIWLSEGEAEITAEEFRKIISIESIVFYDDLSSAIYCNAGDIFWGHTIVIDIDENGNYKHSNIAG
jgi:hypothetical protein